MLASLSAQPGFALWLLPHLVLIAAPPLAVWLWSRGGRFSLKHIILATAAVAMLGNNVAWAVKAALAYGPISLFKELAHRSSRTWLIVFSISLIVTFTLQMLFRITQTADEANAAEQPRLPEPIE